MKIILLKYNVEEEQFTFMYNNVEESMMDAPCVNSISDAQEFIKVRLGFEPSLDYMYCDIDKNKIMYIEYDLSEYSTGRDLEYGIDDLSCDDDKDFIIQFLDNEKQYCMTYFNSTKTHKDKLKISLQNKLLKLIDNCIETKSNNNLDMAEKISRIYKNIK